MSDLDWLIVGGGIHGVHLAARLIGEAGVAPEGVRIVDPAERLLTQWRTFTETTGMTHLRSPSVHHLDLHPWSLQRFAGKRKTRERGLSAAPYDRPTLAFFNAHCDHVLDTFGLDELHIRARATSCSVDCGGVAVRLSNESELAARQIVLALGAGEQPRWPDWAPRGHGRIHHIFEPGLDTWPASDEKVAVVGGGISACQVALRLFEEGVQVHLVSRHAVRQHQFDSDPGWLGPRLMDGFRSVRDLDGRRALISEARHRGSVPPDVRHALRGALQSTDLRWHEGEVEAIEAWDDELRVELSTQDVLEVDRLLLATGFASRRPGGSMVDDLVASSSLPCARCGYPVVDSALRWHPRIHVSGPLAELELGPAARNIAGARRAGDRLVDAIRREGSASVRKAS